jgi:hypothetical protein
MRIEDIQAGDVLENALGHRLFVHAKSRNGRPRLYGSRYEGGPEAVYFAEDLVGYWRAQ